MPIDSRGTDLICSLVHVSRSTSKYNSLRDASAGFGGIPAPRTCGSSRFGIKRNTLKCAKCADITYSVLFLSARADSGFADKPVASRPHEISISSFLASPDEPRPTEQHRTRAISGSAKTGTSSTHESFLLLDLNFEFTRLARGQLVSTRRTMTSRRLPRRQYV